MLFTMPQAVQDALVQSGPDRWAPGSRLGARIKRQLGLQEVDILVTDPATPDSAVLAAARHDGAAA